MKDGHPVRVPQRRAHPQDRRAHVAVERRGDVFARGHGLDAPRSLADGDAVHVGQALVEGARREVLFLDSRHAAGGNPRDRVGPRLAVDAPDAFEHESGRARGHFEDRGRVLVHRRDLLAQDLALQRVPLAARVGEEPLEREGEAVVDLRRGEERPLALDPVEDPLALEFGHRLSDDAPRHSVPIAHLAIGPQPIPFVQAVPRDPRPQDPLELVIVRQDGFLVDRVGIVRLSRSGVHAPMITRPPRPSPSPGPGVRRPFRSVRRNGEPLVRLSVQVYGGRNETRSHARDSGNDATRHRRFP